MNDRLLSKSLESNGSDRDQGSRRSRECDSEDEQEPRAEVLLRTRIPGALRTIGGNLDRALSILQRMEHKLEAASR